MKKIFLVLVLSIMMVSTAQAAVFVKIDGIDGESRDADHDKWIDVLSFSQGMHQPGGGATGQSRRRGSVIVEDIQVSKELDKSSPKLQEAIASGKVIPKVEIDVTASYSNEGRITYYQYELKNVMVTSYSVTATGDEEVPVEDFSLNYEEIKVTYKETDDRGGIMGIIEWLFNVRRR